MVKKKKNLPTSAGDTGDTGDASLIPGSGRSPGVVNGNPLQCSCWANPMDRGIWWATVAKSQTWLSTHAEAHCLDIKLIYTLNKLHHCVTITIIHTEKTKKFLWLTILLYLLYCSGLEPNLQYLQGMPVLKSGPHRPVCAISGETEIQRT